jgi:tRNA threonylcarbamoyladenosine biosynthesis protein TsaB
MRILAADTSTGSGSIALMDGERILLEWVLVASQTHNRRLLRSVEDALQAVGWDLGDVNAYAVTVGPGSFTGLRIGLTTIKTLAWASGKPFIGIPSLDVLAAALSHSSVPICPLIDAHKQEVYGCLYRSDSAGDVHPVGSYRAMPAQAVGDWVRERTLFCGDGWLLYGRVLQELLGPLAVGAAAPFHLIRAGVLADLARKRLERGESHDPVTTVPLYVRPSEAELKHPHLKPNLFLS